MTRYGGKLPLKLTGGEARGLRLHSQHLAKRESIDAGDLVRYIAAVQAQDKVAELLAVRVRTTGLSAVEVENARVESRTVVRTWAMRGTMHLLASKDVRWVLRVVGSFMVRKAKRRQRELGLTDDVYRSAVRVLRRALESDGALTRRQIAERWAGQGLPSEGQAVVYLLHWSSLEGIICFGPTVGGESTHVLSDTWIEKDLPEPPDPVAELARRYVTAYAPTTPEDFGMWSGLPAREARRAFQAIERELVGVTVDGVGMWMPESHDGLLHTIREDVRPSLRMLGAFDPYLLGYRVRELGVALELLKQVHPGGGIIRPTILVDGRAIATWTRKRSGRRLIITVRPFESLSQQARTGIDAEVEDIGRFLGLEVAWNVE